MAETQRQKITTQGNVLACASDQEWYYSNIKAVILCLYEGCAVGVGVSSFSQSRNRNIISTPTPNPNPADTSWRHHSADEHSAVRCSLVETMLCRQHQRHLRILVIDIAQSVCCCLFLARVKAVGVEVVLWPELRCNAVF